MELIEMACADGALVSVLSKYIEKDNEEQKNRLYPVLHNFAEIILYNEAFIKFNCIEDSCIDVPTEEQIDELVEKTWLNRAMYLEMLSKE